MLEPVVARAPAPRPPPRQGPPPGPPRPPPPPSPWEALKVELEKIGGAAKYLASGRATLDGNLLTVSLPAGRVLASGRRAMRNAAVVEAVARHYGDRVKVDIIALPNTGTASDRQKALAKKVLTDPAIQRVMASLGASLLRAVPLTDGE